VQSPCNCAVVLFVHTLNGMRSGKIFVVGVGSVVVACSCLVSIAAGCNSSSGEATFGGDPDAQPESSVADTGFFQDDGGDGGRDAPTTCAPALPPGFAPTWKPPIVSPTACKTADLTAYAAACLGQPYDPTKCDAFKAGSATCAACVESDSAAAQLAPVLWHDGRTYFTLNIAGCIAIESGDTTGAGCAAAYQAIIACKELSCDSCFSIQSPTFQTFAACEQAAGSGVCGTYGVTESQKCATVRDAGAPTSACFPGATDTTVDLFMKIAPHFCGG
jgi:hypothetical protein